MRNLDLTAITLALMGAALGTGLFAYFDRLAMGAKIACRLVSVAF